MLLSLWLSLPRLSGASARWLLILIGCLPSMNDLTYPITPRLFYPCYSSNWYTTHLFVFCLFVCLRSATTFFPPDQLPKEDLRRSPSTTQTTRHHPGLVSVSVPSPPVPFVMHPASGPYPPLSSCPIHIPYRVSGLFLPCFSVLHIYSNPTEKNPSTNIKPPHTNCVNSLFQ